LIKEKKYPADCSVGGLDRRPIIIITHDESIFSANDAKHQAWIPENGAFLRPKGKGKGLMVSDFLLPWSRLNLFSLPKTQQDELVNAGIPMEAATTFEYGNDEGHWDGAKLLQQIFDRALPIAEALYPGYELLFLFDNATSHSTYAEDALRTNKMNKGDGGQQSFLRNGWFRNENTIHSQQMWYFQQDPTRGSQVRVQKGIQRVLEERGLWPSGGLRLDCRKPKCLRCQDIATCKVCIKGKMCDSCKTEKVHTNSKCTPRRPCDGCVQRKDLCQCVPKKFCPSCEDKQNGKCQECENLPPKCTSNG